MADLIAFLLASARLSRMLYDIGEDGPFYILVHIRNILGVYEDEPNQLALAITCPYCISVWVGFAFALLSLNKRLFRVLAWPFAASAATIYLYERYERNG